MLKLIKKDYFLWKILPAADVHSPEMRHEFKKQKNLAMARQTLGFGFERIIKQPN